MEVIIFVGVWCVHNAAMAVEQKRKNAALSVECKLFFFTMEILRMPRVLFLALFNYSKKIAYPNTSIESAARSCLDNRGCTVQG